MRILFWLAAAMTIAAVVSMTGCGYAGEPKPPALKRPDKVMDLAAAEHGSKIIVTFTLPEETTEGLPITEPPDVELRIGAQNGTFSQADWEKNSERVPVPEEPFPERSLRTPRAKAIRKSTAAKATANTKAAQQAAKQTKATAKAAEQAELARTINVDVAKYAGKTVVIGVRLHGPGGRDAGWSRLVTLEAAPVLATPRDLRPSDARSAVHLQWTGDAPGYRIFRRAAGGQGSGSDWVRIGDSTQASFDDQTVEYGKTWQYYVQGVRRNGESEQVSEPSDTITFTPKDIFPPAMPTGLAAISGARTIELVWDRVADSDLAGYRVYRNGQKIADGLVTPAYSDANVTVGTKYSYQVSAVDQAGNESEKSAAFEAAME